MTYKLDYMVSKIVSPISLLLPNGEKQDYKNGEALAESTFTEQYQIESIQVDNGVIKVSLRTSNPPDIPSFF